MTFDVDLFVIGGGSGGVRAARMAAATGARVALAEQSRMGGTCVIRGCVPKKLMVFASAFREMPAEARAYGWDIPDGRFDWPAMRTRLSAELDRLEGVYRRLLDQAGVHVHDTRATLDPAGAPEASGPGALRGPVRVTTTAAAGGVFDAVLFATGRRPNTAGLGLAPLGVGIGARGEIMVDSYSQTAVPSVFAVGDVTDRVNLTPVAIREGMAFVDTVFRGIPTPVDHDLVPAAVFTQPELGAVGLTEAEARAREPVEVYSTFFRPMRGAFAGAPGRVMMKLIVSRATRRVLGCHIVAPEAGEMIQLAAIAVRMGATKEDFDRTVAVHPTMAEELVTMRTPVRTA